MTAHDSATALRRIVEDVINAHDLGRMDELFAEGFIEHETPPGYAPGIKGTRQLFSDLFTAFPDIHAEIDDVIAEGDKAVFRMTWSGTQSGPFMGIPPTGKHAVWSVFDIIRVENGKGVEHWGQMDMLSLLQQLGVIPAPEPATA